MEAGPKRDPPSRTFCIRSYRSRDSVPFTWRENEPPKGMGNHGDIKEMAQDWMIAATGVMPAKLCP